MIKIRKSKNADSRSATHIVKKDELLKNSEQHINDVWMALKWMGDRLYQAGIAHDHTKLFNINEFYADFHKSQTMKRADPKIDTDFKNWHWFNDIHLTERHHLTDRCPDDVNLFDVLERVADITMAGLARSGKIYDDDLSSEILQKAYQNTIKLLAKNVEIIDK
jgi:hypothetical protein